MDRRAIAADPAAAAAADWIVTIDEERPAGTVQTNHSGGGLFSRLKDAFNNG